MTTEVLLLGLVIFVALAFDFTNGFHDTANAMAASIATNALKPKTAVALCAILNLVGAFLSVEVALTVTNAVIKVQDKTGAPKAELLSDGGQGLLLILLAGLAGAIIWNVTTWLLGLPSSSSHALMGGMVGATLAGLGISGVNWAGDGTKLDGVVGKIMLPALFSPLIAMVVAMTATWLVYKVTSGVADRFRESRLRWGQIGGASLVSLAHGTNDAQKTMGIVTLALIATGHWTDLENIPFWVKLVCAAAIALGTYLGGWRIIRTLGKGLVDIARPQGMAADGATAAVILASSHLGFALSTTHVASGSILGSGIGRKGAEVRWAVFGRMLIAWALTFPMAALVAAVMWYIGAILGGGLAGGLVVFALLVASNVVMWKRSRHGAIDHKNVNDDWKPKGGVGGEPQVVSLPDSQAHVG